MRRTHHRWIPRKGAVGVYNCAGMVWASRRTCLTEPNEWQTILNEDGYRRLNSHTDAALGDVVVYRDRSGEILHVAKVCNIERMDARGEPFGNPIVKALSKWDQRFGEDIHHLDDVNLVGGTEHVIEIWTDRPEHPDPRIALIEKLPLIIT
jgi:hypothetical protein